jgi:hypothetical protein
VRGYVADEFEEVLAHGHDVAVLDARDDAEFAVLVAAVLEDFLEGPLPAVLATARLLRPTRTR